MSSLLEVRDLCKYFKTSGGLLHAVDMVTFDVPERTTLGVVGESGCGKSTLGRAILGLTEVTSGEIRFKDEDITNARGKTRKIVKKNIQIIFQDPYSSLDSRMSVKQLIAEPLKITKTYKGKDDLNKRIDDLMDTVGLSSRYLLAYPHELDGGRRQRIGVARALAVEPEFIVCDEPVSALDVSIQAQILNLMSDLQKERGLTYIFITHNLSVVKHISDDIMVMYCGCMVEKSNTRELFRTPLHPYTQGLLSAIPIPSLHVQRERKLLKGEISSPVNPEPGCRFAARCEYASEICARSTPDVEEVEPDHLVACHRVREINKI